MGKHTEYAIISGMRLQIFYTEMVCQTTIIAKTPTNLHSVLSYSYFIAGGKIKGPIQTDYTNRQFPVTFTFEEQPPFIIFKPHTDEIDVQYSVITQFIIVENT